MPAMAILCMGLGPLDSSIVVTTGMLALQGGSCGGGLVPSLDATIASSSLGSVSIGSASSLSAGLGGLISEEGSGALGCIMGPREGEKGEREVEERTDIVGYTI